MVCIIDLLEFAKSKSKFYKGDCPYIMEPPIKDPPRKGQPPYKGHSSRSLYHSINMFLTSKKRTTSKIRTEAVSPKCPLFRGATVEAAPQHKANGGRGREGHQMQPAAVDFPQVSL